MEENKRFSSEYSLAIRGRARVFFSAYIYIYIIPLYSLSIKSYRHALTYLQRFNTKILHGENDGADLHHDQARWRPERLGTWAFSFLFESVIFFFTLYGSCVWLNRKCRKGKFWVSFSFSFSYISETRTCKFSIEFELGLWVFVCYAR
jgi:hypothetical protein